MKTIAQLIFTYFNATIWSRCATLIGLIGITITIFKPPVASLVVAQLLGVGGIAAFFLGSALMPILAGGLLNTRSVAVLPFGRAKVLASAFITAALTALPLPIISVLVVTTSRANRAAEFFAEPSTFLGIFQMPFFWRLYFLILLFCTWLYVLLWFATRHRHSAPSIRTWLVVIVLIVVPPEFVRLTPDTHWTISLAYLMASWALISSYCVFGSRLRQFNIKSLANLGTAFRWPAASSDETSLLLGTTHPWLIQFGLMTGIMIAMNVLAMPIAWISYLALCSLLTGGYSCNAAARSRALWLRQPWDRPTLFHEVEMHFWLHNSISRLAVLLILMIGVGVYKNLPVNVITFGALILVLGTTISTYLGLTITRTLGWSESAMTIAAMALLMSAVYFVAWKDVDKNIVASLLLALVIAAAILRQVAKRRWQDLDWMQCKAIKIA
jgi:hypothetical protein